MHIKKAPLETDNTTISAYATRKPVLFVNFLTDIQVNAAYDKLNPAAAFKNLLNDAVKALEKQEEKSALKKAKKKTFIG